MANTGPQKTNTVVLELFQKSTFDSAEVLAGTFTFSTTETEPFAVQGQTGSSSTVQLPALPFGFKMEPHNGLVNIVSITHKNTLNLIKFEQAINASYTVRSFGGKKHEKEPHNYMENRGGYQFTAFDKAASTLTGKGGIKSEDSIQSLAVSFNKKHTFYRLPLLYPANPYDDNSIFDELTFEFTFKITFGSNSWSGAGPKFMFHQKFEFLTDRNDTQDVLKEHLKAEYGNPSMHPPLHARDYGICVSGADDVSSEFLRHLDTVVTFINSKIPAGAHYSLSQVELACVFLSEGAFLVLDRAIANKTAPDNLRFSGYNDLGIDRYVTAWKKNSGLVRALTPKILEDKISKPDQIKTIINEKHNTFETFKELNFLESVHAVACLYADSKSSNAADFADPKVMGAWTGVLSRLPVHVQHFWATLYYNTGAANGRTTLKKHGIEYHDLIWKLEDDHDKYKSYEKYNANWRTATMRLLNVQMNP